MTRSSWFAGCGLVMLGLVLLCPLGVMAGTELGGTDVGFLEKAVIIMQQVVNFFEGPFGNFFAVVAFGLAIGVWIMSSRGDGELGWLGRVAIGAMLLINITAIISNLKAS